MAFGFARRAMIELGASSRRLDRDLRTAQGKLGKFAGRVRQRVGGALRGTLGKALGVGSIAGVAMIGREVMQFEEQLTRLAIQGRLSDQAMGQLRDRIGSVSTEMGVAREELLAGTAGFVSLTGDIDGASAAIEIFAKVSKASGASLQDIAGTAASLRQNLQIDPADFEQAFSTLLAQGKAGAIELRELSTLMAGVAPQFTQFGAKGTDALAELGAALQLTRQGFGTAAEAGTGLRSLMTSLSRRADRFERAGVKMFDVGEDGVKRFREFSDIIEQIGASDLARDPTLLTKAFGSAEAVRAFNELQKVPGALREMTDEAKSAKDVQEDFDRFQASSAGRMQKAMVTLKNAIAEAFTPERVELIASAMEKFAGAVEWAADNWKIFAALFVGTKLVGVASSLNGIVGLLAGAKGGAAVRGLAGLARGMTALGAAGAALGAGYAVGTIINELTGADRIGTKLASVVEGRSRNRTNERLAKEAQTFLDPTGELTRQFGAQHGSGGIDRAGLAVEHGRILREMFADDAGALHELVRGATAGVAQTGWGGMLDGEELRRVVENTVSRRLASDVFGGGRGHPIVIQIDGKVIGEAVRDDRTHLRHP